MTAHHKHDTEKGAPKVFYLNPLIVRIWHWINALGIVVLCLTGVQIRFPENIHWFGDYTAAINLHNTAGITVCIAWIVWLYYYAFSLRMLFMVYVPTAEDLRTGMLRQALFYGMGYFKGEPNPHVTTPFSKFNPLQKMAYFTIMSFLIPTVCLTGVLLLNVVPLRQYVLLVGGLKILDAIHLIIGASLGAFVISHIYLATLGHTVFAHFKPMWTGWETDEH